MKPASSMVDIEKDYVIYRLYYQEEHILKPAPFLHFFLKYMELKENNAKYYE